MFTVILNYMRTGKLPLWDFHDAEREMLRDEAYFYQIGSLLDLLHRPQFSTRTQISCPHLVGVNHNFPPKMLRLFVGNPWLFKRFTTAAAGGGLSANPSAATSFRKTYFPCWCCQLPVSSSSYFCPYCSKITDALPKDVKCSYFDLLQTPIQSFKLDTKQLERQYRQLAMQLHPDQFSQKSIVEKELSAYHAARLNEAYSTLKSPLRRALYMLELSGVSALGEDAGTNATDMSILTETMELRERLDEAETEDEYEKLRADVKERVAEVESDLAAALGDTQNLDSAVQVAVRLRYLEKVMEEVSEKIRNFGD